MGFVLGLTPPTTLKSFWFLSFRIIRSIKTHWSLTFLYTKSAKWNLFFSDVQYFAKIEGGHEAVFADDSNAFQDFEVSANTSTAHRPQTNDVAERLSEKLSKVRRLCFCSMGLTGLIGGLMDLKDLKALEEKFK